jgi:chromosome partitioning protein
MKLKVKVITVCQRKGGVGKSTSSLNLAYALAEKGYRILIIDLDDQQNTTSSISAHLSAELTIADLLLRDDVTVTDVMVTTEWPNVRIIPASSNLSGATKHLDSEVGGHLILKEKLSQAQDLDYVIIDNSPSLNILVINGFCASDYLLIPLSSKYLTLQGLQQTLAAFNKVKSRLNSSLSILGMAFVIHDGRSTLATEVLDKVRQKYPSLIFNTVVGTNIRIEEAQVKKQSVLTYAPDDRGAVQYRALAQEILDRIERLEAVLPGGGEAYEQESIG